MHLRVEMYADLYALIHDGLDKTLLEAQQRPADEHDDPQLAEIQDCCVNQLQHLHGLHHEIHCKQRAVLSDASWTTG